MRLKVLPVAKLFPGVSMGCSWIQKRFESNKFSCLELLEKMRYLKCISTCFLKGFHCNFCSAIFARLHFHWKQAWLQFVLGNFFGKKETMKSSCTTSAFQEFLHWECLLLKIDFDFKWRFIYVFYLLFFLLFLRSQIIFLIKTSNSHPVQSLKENRTNGCTSGELPPQHAGWKYAFANWIWHPESSSIMFITVCWANRIMKHIVSLIWVGGSQLPHLWFLFPLNISIPWAAGLKMSEAMKLLYLDFHFLPLSFYLMVLTESRNRDQPFNRKYIYRVF